MPAYDATDFVPVYPLSQWQNWVGVVNYSVLRLIFEVSAIEFGSM
jgi:hypothetical protein